MYASVPSQLWNRRHSPSRLKPQVIVTRHHESSNLLYSTWTTKQRRKPTNTNLDSYSNPESEDSYPYRLVIPVLFWDSILILIVGAPVFRVWPGAEQRQPILLLRVPTPFYYIMLINSDNPTSSSGERNLILGKPRIPIPLRQILFLLCCARLVQIELVNTLSNLLACPLPGPLTVSKDENQALRHLQSISILS